MEFEEREKLISLFEKYKNLLSQSQIQTLHLYLIEDLSFSEIAEILAVSKQAVNDALKKGQMKLKKIADKLAIN